MYGDKCGPSVGQINSLEAREGETVATCNERLKTVLYLCVPGCPWINFAYMHSILLRGNNCMLLAHRPQCTVTLNSN